MRIHGTFCASLTPFNNDYTINHDMFFNHCNDLINKGADYIAIFGTTGEANLISMDSKIGAMHALIEKGFNSKKILPGTGLTSLHETIKLTKVAKDLKMPGVLMLPSYYYNNLSNVGIIDYYSMIIDSISDQNFKILLYHIPQISGVSINLNIIEELIKKYPSNVVGIKDSSNDLNNMIEIIKNFPNFRVFSGSDSLTLPIMKQGGAGAITATANISVTLLSFIVKNANDIKKEKLLESAHSLQDKIRKLVFRQEQISFMKALIGINTKNNLWNKIMPPLINLDNPKNNKNLIETQKLLKEMKELSSSF